MSNEKIMYNYVTTEFKQNLENTSVSDFVQYALENNIITYKTMRDYLIKYEFKQEYKQADKTRTSILKDLSIKYDLGLTRVREIASEKKRKKRP
jgi:hypothetical protein